jgi:hypothetical protein
MAQRHHKPDSAAERGHRKAGNLTAPISQGQRYSREPGRTDARGRDEESEQLRPMSECRGFSGVSGIELVVPSTNETLQPFHSQSSLVSASTFSKNAIHRLRFGRVCRATAANP